MRGVWGFAIVLMVGSGAAAEDLASSSSPRETRPPTVLLFSGTDIWRNGAFLHGGLMWSPGGLDEGGFTMKLLVGGGAYRYWSGLLGKEVSGTQFTGSARAGWRVKSDRFEGTIFVGPDIQDYRLHPHDIGSRMQGRYIGGRAGLDVWWEPGPGLMAALNLSGATAGGEYGVRAAIGWRVFDAFFLGPEASAEGSTGYSQVRGGIHATGLKIHDLEWSAGAGWVSDSDDRSGIYGRLGVLTRY